jgi:hypothetical protein
MRTFTLLLAAVILASCGSLRKTSKVETFDQQTEASSEAQTATITVEKADTVVTLPADTLEGGVRLQELIDSSVLVIENDRADLELKYDPVSKRIRSKVTIKEQLIPIKVDRTTVTVTKEATDYKSDTTSKKVEETKKRTSPLIPWWFWIVAILVMGAIIVWRAGLLRPPWP